MFFAASVNGGSYNESNLKVPVASEDEEKHSDKPVIGDSNEVDISSNEPDVELTFENDGTKNQTVRDEDTLTIENQGQEEMKENEERVKNQKTEGVVTVLTKPTTGPDNEELDDNNSQD